MLKSHNFFFFLTVAFFSLIFIRPLAELLLLKYFQSRGEKVLFAAVDGDRGSSGTLKAALCLREERRREAGGTWASTANWAPREAHDQAKSFMWWSSHVQTSRIVNVARGHVYLFIRELFIREYVSMFSPSRGSLYFRPTISPVRAADVDVPADSHAPLEASPSTSGLRAPDGTYLLSAIERSERGVCCSLEAPQKPSSEVQQPVWPTSSSPPQLGLNRTKPFLFSL